MALMVNHQGPFPAVTITFNLAPGATLEGSDDRDRRRRSRR